MRLMVRDLLRTIQHKGVQTGQSFYVSFNTNCSGVEVSQFIKDKHPNEMLIVLQQEFENLTVDDGGFGVSLTLNNKSERIYVSFNAITAFVDPAENFSINFEAQSHIFHNKQQKEPKLDNIVYFPKNNN